MDVLRIATDGALQIVQRFGSGWAKSDDVCVCNGEIVFYTAFARREDSAIAAFGYEWVEFCAAVSDRKVTGIRLVKVRYVGEPTPPIANSLEEW